jgi:predicted amidohydrolase
MRIAIAQIQAIKGNIKRNIEIHLKWINQAIQNNADMIVFPELSLSGYEPDLAEKLATNQDDKRLDKIQSISDENNITIGVGLPTRNEGNVFVSMIIFQPFKKRTTYSKQYLYPPEEQIFTAGKNPMVLEYKTEVISPAICYETTNKAHCEFAKRNNATIYIASVLSSIKGIDTELKLLSEIAKNNNLITFMANYFGKSGGYECAGKSSVWNEEGELIGQLGDKEGLIIFDTKSKEIIKIKKTNKRVLLFLPQGFEEYEAGVFTDVIGWSRVIGIEPVEVVTAGLRHEVKCKWNFNVRPEISFEDINISDYDALAIPGGFEDAGFYEDAFDERFLKFNSPL